MCNFALFDCIYLLCSTAVTYFVRLLVLYVHTLFYCRPMYASTLSTAVRMCYFTLFDYSCCTFILCSTVVTVHTLIYCWMSYCNLFESSYCTYIHTYIHTYFVRLQLCNWFGNLKKYKCSTYVCTYAPICIHMPQCKMSDKSLNHFAMSNQSLSESSMLHILRLIQQE
jgi:hypothetical protein